MVAAMLAYRRDLNVLVGGMCETDFSGYPDCRDDAIKAMQLALNIGMDARLNLVTPLMWKNKKETWQLAAELGGQGLVDLIVNETHTCYVGEHDKLNTWGFGCGECPACLLRKKALKNSFPGETGIIQPAHKKTSTGFPMDVLRPSVKTSTINQDLPSAQFQSRIFGMSSPYL